MVHRILCLFGWHYGICQDGYYRCSYCSYKDRYR